MDCFKLGDKVRLKKGLSYKSWHKYYENKVHTVSQYGDYTDDFVIFGDPKTKNGETGLHVMANKDNFEIVGENKIGGKLL